jgi:hypoxanthine-DNA glycosylase
MTMVETHPFEIFVPPNAKYLILGSFAAKEAMKDHPKFDASYDWYYGTRRNQFWSILEAVYNMELRDKQSKQDLFTRLGIGIGDIIYQVERDKDSSLDYYLKNPAYNKDAIAHAVDENPIHTIFFTSRFVEKRFSSEFKEIINPHPTIELIALPSPSTRYARMNLEQKITRYKELLPEFV